MIVRGGKNLVIRTSLLSSSGVKDPGYREKVGSRVVLRK